MPRKVPRRIRKGVFGRDPEAYDRARPPYPKRVYEILTSRCGLRRGVTVFEIGPGTGIATRELLRRGAESITLIERDRRMARYVSNSIGLGVDRVKVVVKSFERASLPAESFDLGIAATSFHWLPERLALRRVARALKPGGWWATWGNLHGDPYHPNPLQRALQPVYEELSRRMHRRLEKGPSKASAMKERMRRTLSLQAVSRFDHISREEIRWPLKLETQGLQALWGTFSDVTTLPPRNREWFLNELGIVVDEQFGGKAVVAMLTTMYTARRV